MVEKCGVMCGSAFPSYIKRLLTCHHCFKATPDKIGVSVPCERAFSVMQV